MGLGIFFSLQQKHLRHCRWPTATLSAIQTAINDGSYRFDGQNSQEVINRVSTFTTNKGEGSAKIWDIKGTTEFGSLAGGPIGVAAGAEFRKDSIVIQPDQNIAAGNIVGLGASFSDGTRNVSSAYVEAALPLTRSLEATLAARYDRYSDFGSSTNPKIGLEVEGAAKCGVSLQLLDRVPGTDTFANESICHSQFPSGKRSHPLSGNKYR